MLSETVESAQAMHSGSASDRNVDGLDPHMIAALREIANVRAYPPETVLTYQGESERTFYVIESGYVVVSRRLEDGEEQLLNTLGNRSVKWLCWMTVRVWQLSGR